MFPDWSEEKKNNYRADLLIRMEELGVPGHCQSALAYYIVDRRPTGDFLRCLLENDLRMAFHHADEVNKEAIGDYVVFLYSHAPALCWGRPSAYANWINGRDLEDYGNAD